MIPSPSGRLPRCTNRRFLGSSTAVYHCACVKLLIVAGPYEADRIRRAAVAAGFETVAVEPGESLSGWITASRPDLIILAYQNVSSDPQTALAKVRAVPRGRVPVFLVGEAEEEETLRPLADGFFIRPVAASELLQKAKEVTAREANAKDATSRGALPHHGSDGRARTETGLAVEATGGRARAAPARRSGAEGPALRPLVALAAEESLTPPRGLPGTPPFAPSDTGAAPRRFGALAETIDAAIDAEIENVIRQVGSLRLERPESPSDSEPLAHDSRISAELLVGDSSSRAVSGPVPELALAPDPSGAAHAGGAEGPLWSGEGELDLPSLFGQLHRSRVSGRLTVRHGGAETYVVFDEGAPKIAGSNRMDDRLGEMLVRTGRFTRAQIAACAEDALGSGRRMGAVLVEHGLVKMPELPELVRWHHEQILCGLFRWTQGAWVVTAGGDAAAETVVLARHPAALVLRGVRAGYGLRRCTVAVGGAGAVFRLRGGAEVRQLLENMELSETETRATRLFDGMHTIDEAAARSAMARDAFLALALALKALGAVVEEHDAATDRERVLRTYTLVEHGSYFDILGVPLAVAPEVTAQQLRLGYERRMSELAPENLHAEVVRELARELREARGVVEEAWRLMSDPDLRERYRYAVAAAGAAESSRARAEGSGSQRERDAGAPAAGEAAETAARAASPSQQR